jgi:suppressor of ftsI
MFAFMMIMVFTFQSSSFGYNTFAFAQNQNQSSYLSGMNFSKSHDVYSKNGFLNTTLVAEYKIGKVGNQITTAMVYNGSLPGPTYHVYPGDRVVINLVNRLNESTNLHFHGMHVSPANNSDNVFLEIAPGKTQQYVVDIPKNHEPGTNWYHPHLHRYTYGQVSAGLSGMFIVEGLEKLLPKPLQNITQHTFAMRDFPFDNLFVTTHNLSNTVASQDRLTVNGEVNPVVNMKSGETQLWRLANIGPENELTVEFPGHKFHVIAEDGSPVWKVWDNDTLFMQSGKRFDVLVTATGNGTFPLRSLNNSLTAPYDFNIATVKIQGNQKAVQPAANIIPTGLIPKRDLNLVNVAAHRVLNFSSNDRDWIYTINNKTFDPNRVDEKVKLGTVEEWKLINLDQPASFNYHPFHIHTNHFQVMSVNGKPYDANGRQDVVNIPTGGNVVIRIPAYDFVGKTVYHCHLLFHEDFGMMGNVEWVK